MRSRAAVLAVLATLAALPLVVSGAAPAGAAEPARDGSIERLAAPSCWAIKQANPSSPDGVYWLQTPTMAPQRFYCDMTTDGGGWILVGRGRNGWSFDYTGQGTAASIADTPAGTGAFAPSALPAATIDNLLNGVPVRDLPDGVRIRRATNEAGTSWQEVRWDFRHLDKWTWAFGGGMVLDSIRLNNTTYTGGNTRDSMVTFSGSQSNQLVGQNNLSRLFTYSWQPHGFQAGFSYGTSIGGQNNATSYLWENTTENAALPFTQVFIRPRTTAATTTFTPLPDAGLPAAPLRPLLQNTTEGGTAPWGVTGYLATSGTIAAEDVEVQSFAQIGNTVFVGGKFRYVQQGSNTATRVEQRYLAAFDVNTGDWVNTFRPVLDGPVWDMAATPDGRLIVGGEFLNVNGAFSPGVVALDPTTGATSAGWNATVTKNGSTTTRPLVRAMDIRGDWIYLGGDFNRVNGGTSTNVIVGKAARVRWTNGQVDGTWKPNFPGGIIDLSVDETNTRVYFAGYFDAISGITTQGVGAVTTSSPPQVIPWQWTPTAAKHYQQTVLARNGRVYHGGAEHNIDAYVVNGTNPPTFVRRNMAWQGGDFQAIAILDGVVYGACHCGDYNYADSMTWTPRNPSRTDEIRYVGAYDATTMQPIPDFLPAMDSRTGDGPWDLMVASTGCMWVGGDMNRGGGGAWAGGFTRYCPRDTTPPTVPTNVTATLTGDDVRLTWTGSTDDRGAQVRYEVYRDDRIIGTVAGTSFTDPDRTAVSRYFVRAFDVVGNRSATTAVRSVTPPPPALGTPVAAGSSWSYLAGGTAAPAGWNLPAFDATAWPTGVAPLGWAEVDTATTIPSAGVTSYFVRRFEVTDPAAVGSLLVRLRRDDGAVVYINGVEVARSAMPSGPVSSTTLAPFTSGADETRFFDHVAPAYPLVAGTNVIAVELHQAQANNADASFDLELIARSPVAGDATAPTAPAVTATRTGATTASLSWTPSTDDVELMGYRVRRNGTDVGFVAAPATTFDDGGLATSTTYTYEVTALDTSGNASTPGTASYTTDQAAGLLAVGSTWHWYYNAAAPAATWNQPSFDASTWASGPGELGYGESDEATAIPAGATPRPITAYFRSTFTVTDPSRIAGVDLDVIRDDGVVVYVNGVEVGRDNMPAGTITSTTPAVVLLSDRAPEITPVRFVVPPSALVAGVNTIAVEVHQSDAWSGDLSMSVRATARFV